jgi:predicted Zn-dependent peptidase
VSHPIHQHTFPNGLTLLAERMDDVRSAALNFLVPAGCVFDPPRRLGMASLLCELLTRGAGNRDSRQLALALDNLGVDHRESVGNRHARFWGATLARNLPGALELYADILLRPHLPEEELEPVKALALQDLQALEDEPQALVMRSLHKHNYPVPLSNDSTGTAEGIEATTLEEIRAFHGERFRPAGSILSVAGDIHWEELRDQVGALFGGWQGEADQELDLGPEPEHRDHVTKESEQTHIAVAYPSVPVVHPDYYNALGAVNVLHGGMSARLFTEIREKRGLCYAVSAGYQAFKDRGSIVCYSGTTNQRAQETLDQLLYELARLAEGILPDEVERVQAGLKSTLIMRQESTSARAGVLANDWYYFGRVRGFDEIRAAIDGLTPSSIVEHVRRFPPRDFRIVTLGPSALRVSAQEELKTTH